jgi:hypothetical protein
MARGRFRGSFPLPSRRYSGLIAGAFGLGASLAASGQSAWIPDPGQWFLAPVYTFQTFDEFWLGEQSVSNPNNGDSLDQHTAYLSAEYGLARNWAADLAIGYTHSSSSAFNPTGQSDSDDGLADTQLGIRYTLVDENDPGAWLPLTLTLRAGGIIEGTYDPDFPFSAGDGASGARFSLLWGKNFGTSGFSSYGELGFQTRTDDVPDDFLASVGIGYTFLIPISLHGGYRLIHGLSGPDIGDPGFGASFGFPQVKEISHNVEAGIGYTDAGNRFYQFFYARTFDGRNTGEKDVFGFSVTFVF